MSLDTETSIHSRIGYMSTPTKDDSFSSSLNDSKLDLTGYNTSPATTPVGRDNKAGWYNIHEKHTSLAKRPFAEIILCGDSIIAGLARYPKVWREFFEPLKALNFGIGGDRTQHVLWRAENINITSSVKFVVLHLGTNNIDRDTPNCIANGILSVALTFQEKLPGLKVIVTALLPRDLDISFRRIKIEKVNKILKEMCRDQLQEVYFMKQDDDWTLPDGQLNEQFYYTDCLHLIEKGNEKFAHSISKAIKEVTDSGCIEYSSDEGEGADVEEHQYKRLLSERRKRKRSGSDDEHQGAKHSRRSRDERKHSRSKSKSKSHRESSSKRESSESKYSWSAVRERGLLLKKEKNGDHTEKDEKVEQEKVESDIPLQGVAKSIDITLDEKKRLEARRNKFSGVSSSLTAKPSPSALVTKIMKSKLETKKYLDAQRHKHSVEATPSPPKP